MSRPVSVSETIPDPNPDQGHPQSTGVHTAARCTPPGRLKRPVQPRSESLGCPPPRQPGRSSRRTTGRPSNLPSRPGHQTPHPAPNRPPATRVSLGVLSDRHLSRRNANADPRVRDPQIAQTASPSKPIPSVSSAPRPPRGLLISLLVLRGARQPAPPNALLRLSAPSRASSRSRPAVKERRLEVPRVFSTSSHASTALTASHSPHAREGSSHRLRPGIRRSHSWTPFGSTRLPSFGA